jgi:TonB family protein
VLAVSSIGGRGFVLGASALLHVAVFAVASHGRLPSDGLGLADTNATEIAIDVNRDRAPQEVAHPLEHHHTHTHAYPVAPDHDAVDHDESVAHTPYLPHDHDATEHADHPADAPSDVVAAPAAPAALPNFSISIGSAPTSHGVVQTNGTGTGAAIAAVDDDAPVAADHVAEAAHLVSSVLPAYPADARSEEVEADVPLEIVVDKSGVVKSVRALGHVGYGFDEAAAVAMRQYRFSPAARGGHAVSVRMPWTVQFRLK